MCHERVEIKLGLIIHFPPFTRFEVIKEFLIEIHFVRKVNKMDHK
jgi:hypothetical protein